ATADHAGSRRTTRSEVGGAMATDFEMDDRTVRSSAEWIQEKLPKGGNCTGKEARFREAQATSTGAEEVGKELARRAGLHLSRGKPRARCAKLSSVLWRVYEIRKK